MTRNDGKSFEKLVAQLYDLLLQNEHTTNVELDVEIASAEGPRQFDVVMYSELANIKLTTVIEVRDWNKNLSITHIDAFHSKMTDVNANKGIMVARKGFSKSAIQKADRLGIDLCTAYDIQNISQFEHKLPVLVHALEFEFQRFLFDFKYGQNSKASIQPQNITVDGIPVFDLVRTQIIENKFPLDVCNDQETLNYFRNLSSSKISPGQRIPDISRFETHMSIWMPSENALIEYHDPITGIKIETGKVKLKNLLGYRFYFGYLNDLPGTIALKSISNNDHNVFYKPEDIVNFKDFFSEFNTLTDVPISEAVNIYCVPPLPNYDQLPAQVLTR